MKSKLFVLVIIIAIVAMSMAVIVALAARRSFETEIFGDLYTEYKQTVGANQQLKNFDGRPFELNLLKDEEDKILEKLRVFGGVACTKKGVDDRDNPIENGVVQIEKEKGKGPLYSFRFKWDESTKLLESVGCTGEFDNSTGIIIVTFDDVKFTLKVLLGDENPKTGRIHHCDWFTIWEGTLNFFVTLEEEL